jgi:hypothetical protein
MAEATQAQIRAAELLEQLWSDGEIGEKVRRAAKAKFPDAKIIDDTVAPFVAPLRAENVMLRERLDKIEKARAEERMAWEEHSAKTMIEQAIDKARRDYSLTEDGIDKAVARVKEMGVSGDVGVAVDAAAAWVAYKTPPTAPAGPTWRSQDLDLFGTKNADEARAELHRNPVKYQDDQIEAFLRDPDGFTRETLGTQ